MAIPSPKETPLPRRDCHASLVMTVRAQLSTLERDASQAKLAERNRDLEELPSLITDLQEPMAAQTRSAARRYRRLRSNGQ